MSVCPPIFRCAGGTDDEEGAARGPTDYRASLDRAVAVLSSASRVIVLSGAGMSTAAGIPDFRSPGGLYGSSAALLERFTFLERAARQRSWQRSFLEDDIRGALTHEFFSVNPLPYHEMRRGFILGLGEGQWKLTIGHIFPEILNRQGKLRMLASQNIDGLDHKVVSDKSKLFNPHGLMSTLVAERLDRRGHHILCREVGDPIYQRYVQLVAKNTKDIYADKEPRQGKSSHMWPGPKDSTPITLEMFGDLLPTDLAQAAALEKTSGRYSVKPGSVLFDRLLWNTTADGQEYDVFGDTENCDLVLVMGTSLSGLTIDNVAHMARDVPRLVFDITDTPVNSIRREGGWSDAKDCHLQGSLDSTILDVLSSLGWLDQLFDYLHLLCLGSLNALKEHVEQRGAGTARLPELAAAIEAEVARERRFYG